MKRLRLIIPVFLLLLVLPLLWLLTTESGLRWTYQQADDYLPETFSLHHLEGKLIGPVKLSGIEFEQDGTRIKTGQIVFDWSPLALLTANINISQLHVQALEIVLPITEATGQEKTDPAASTDISLPDLHLPWRLVLDNAMIDGIHLKQNNQSYRINQVRLNASTLFSKIDIETLSVHADTFRLNIHGELKPVKNYPHQLEINWQAELPSRAWLDGKGQLAGDMQKTQFKQTLSGPLQATLDADLSDVLKQLNWTTRLDIKQFDTHQLDTTLPALSGALKLKAEGDRTTARLDGTLDGSYAGIGAFDANFDLQRQHDNTIQFNRLTLQLPESNTRFATLGSWQPGNNGGDFKLALNWSNLRWPIQGPPQFNSASGNGSLEGTMDQYQIKLTADSPWPELIPSSWKLLADGNASGMKLRSLKVNALNGETIATGWIDWAPALSWQLDVKASDIDPASLHPDWPGRLKAKLSSRGKIESDKLIADADIHQVTGSLRNYPVLLQSRLRWRNNGLDIEQFDFQSGDATLNAEGRLAESMKLKWSVAANNLAELYPQAEGQLNTEGSVSGPQHAPTVKATINGKALSLLDYKVGSLDAVLSIDLFQWQQLDIRLAAEALLRKNVSLQSLTITSIEDRIEAKVVSEKLTALLALRGKPDTNGWHGQIEIADFNSQPFHNWTLKAPAALSLTANRISLQPLCWIGHNDINSNLCITLQRTDKQWQANLDASRMPMLLLAPWLPVDLNLEGKIDATAGLTLHAADKLLGQLNIKLPPGIITYPLLEGERDRWEYQGGDAVVSLTEQGITAKSVLAMSNGDRFDFKAELPGAQLLTLNQTQQTLRADAKLNIHDLGLIEALMPEVQDLKGEVAVNLAASGTLVQPRLSGRATLLKGNLRIPRLGLNINQLSLKSQSSDFEKINFRLDARSGDGDLFIQGHTLLDRTAGWPTEINISGKTFEVSNIPEARVQVSPDLKVKVKNRRFDIQGDVHIPYAKLQPKDITTAARVSDDAVIIGDEQLPEENWLLHTRIRLTLGERVSFYGFGFEGRFGGSLLLEDEPGQLTKATGEINIPEGRYRAYGQRLDVEHGRLLYTGGPLSNPGLDLRAVRHIDDVTAGIKVRGSLNHPQLELFSSPAMGQTDTLAYLLLGGPIENASGEEGAMMAKAALALGLSGGDHLARTLGDRFGLDEMRVESSDKGDQASLVVGRYLSPKLYVSYGVGLVEAINTLTLRYKISDKWQLKAESSEYQGADILYTIER